AGAADGAGHRGPAAARRAARHLRRTGPHRDHPRRAGAGDAGVMITQAICNSYKTELFQGVHQPGDDYRMALYVASATLSKATTAYTSSGEVADGGGYTAGGQSLTGFSVALDGDIAVLDFDDAVWAAATITARGALLYNATRANKALAV